MTERTNGKASVNKKRRSAYSSDEDGSYSTYISEEQYRTMLGEHVQRYKRRRDNPSPNPGPTRTVMPVLKGSLGPKERKSGSEPRLGSRKMESSSEYLTDMIHQKPRKYNEREFASEYKINRLVSSPFPFHKIIILILMFWRLRFVRF